MVRAGVVRTYQAPRLFGQLDARENVLCGTYWRERATAGVGIEQMSVHDIMRLTRTDRLWSRDRRENLQLTFGMSRLIEIARVLLTNPRFVLLDEPAAGLDPDEADVLREIIGVLRDRGIGVALIEHDVPFLLEMADTVTVMNMGTVLLTGSADAVRSDSRVQQIYLGRADAAL
jgi:ABC-type branched-subunit amino acid transport system ATPase component